MHAPDPFQAPQVPSAQPAPGESSRYVAPGAQHQAPPQPVTQTVASTGKHPGLISMLIGGAIMAVRIYAMSARSQAGQDAASQFLGGYNTMFEMAAGALIFSWGFSRYLSSRQSVSGQAEANIFGQVVPFTLVLTIAGLLVGSALN
jgi:hypothetical protein